MVADAAAGAARPPPLALQGGVGVRRLARPAGRAAARRCRRAEELDFRERERYWIEDWARFGPRGAVADQVRFDREWAALRAYAAERGVRIIGDVPIYVAPGSADQRAHPELFQTGAVAGTPPDAYTDKGQLWGNPLYDWPAMQRRGYRWWVDAAARARSSSSTSRASTTSAASSPTGRCRRGRKHALSGRVEARAGPGGVRRRRAGAGPRAAADRRGPRRDHAGGRARCATASACRGWSSSSSASTRATRAARTTRGTTSRTASPTPARTTTTPCAAGTSRSPDERRALVDRAIDDAGVRERRAVVVADPPHVRLAGAVAMVQAQDVLGLGGEARMNMPGTTGRSWRWRLAELPSARPRATAARGRGGCRPGRRALRGRVRTASRRPRRVVAANVHVPARSLTPRIEPTAPPPAFVGTLTRPWPRPPARDPRRQPPLPRRGGARLRREVGDRLRRGRRRAGAREAHEAARPAARAVRRARSRSAPGTGYFSLNLLRSRRRRRRDLHGHLAGHARDARGQRAAARPRRRDRRLRRRRAAVRGRLVRPRARPRRAAPPARRSSARSRSSRACCAPAGRCSSPASRRARATASPPGRSAPRCAPRRCGARRSARGPPSTARATAAPPRPEDAEHALESIVDVHAFDPADLQRLMAGRRARPTPACRARSCWRTGSAGSTARSRRARNHDDIPWLWFQYAFRGYLGAAEGRPRAARAAAAAAGLLQPDDRGAEAGLSGARRRPRARRHARRRARRPPQQRRRRAAARARARRRDRAPAPRGGDRRLRGGRRARATASSTPTTRSRG